MRQQPADYNRERNPVDTQRELAETVRGLSRTVQELHVAVSTLRAEMPTRNDIQAEINKRLPVDTYTIAHAALERELREYHQEFERFAIRSQNGWQSAAPWVAIAVSVVFGAVSNLMALGAILYEIVKH
jgi:hypothetical protein